MSIIDILTMSVRSLLKRKVRTFLTVLGVTVGTASIVLMISLGIAANMNFERQLEGFGDVLNMQIHHWQGAGGGDVILNDAMIDYISSWDGVEVATPIIEMWSMHGQIGRRTAEHISIRGIRPEAMPFLPGFRDIAQGQTIQPGSSGFQAVFGSELPFEFMTDRERLEHQHGGGGGGSFIVRGMSASSARPMPGMPGGSEAPVRVPRVNIFEERIRISYVWGIFAPPSGTGEVDPHTPIIITNRNNQVYEVEAVGLFEGTTWETQRSIVMDIEHVKTLLVSQADFEESQGWGRWRVTDFDTYGYEQAMVRATDINTAVEVFLRLYALGFGWVSSPLHEVATLQEMSDSLQNLLLIIGAVSLFVAFIGIANTMIMSIYERTKEIGVMKVIGAALSDIGRLFLVEAALIGIMGGLIGLGLSYGLSYLLNNMEDGFAFLEALIPRGVTDGYISYIPLWLYGLALAFSAVIGLVAGFLPAMRAMRISALTAIRTD